MADDTSTEVNMPQLGETVTDGTIVKWLVSIGDHVNVDDPLLEVSTDKVDSEIPSPIEGEILDIRHEEGDLVDVGSTLLVIGGSTDTSPAQRQQDERQQSPIEEPTPPPFRETGPNGDGSTDAAPKPESRPETQPLATAPSQSADMPADQDHAAPTGLGGLAPRTTVDGRFLSPAVRARLAATDLGVADLDRLDGTGAGGRISLDDLADAGRLVDTGTDRTSRTVDHGARHPVSSSDPDAQQPERAGRPADGEASTPFNPIRRRTAAHMVQSLATAAHTLVVMEIDYESIAQVRAAQADEFRQRHGVGLTYLAFVAHAVTRAIADHPRVNARVGDDELIERRDVNLGIAVDLDHEGLVVPVLHHADRLRVQGLAIGFAELAVKARDRALTPDDVAGGTFTITNAGGYGTLLTAPIINQPQVAIISTDGVSVQPVAVPQPDGGYALGFRHRGNLCLSFDHRAFDGTYASAFLARVRDIMETDDWEAAL